MRSISHQKKNEPFCSVTDHLCFHSHLSAFFLFLCSGAEVEAGDNARLAMGSHIAAELREAIHSKLGLTGCAGIATNKLLAKLVSGTFKPNQQTSLLPENVGDIMASLSSLRKVPGTHVYFGSKRSVSGQRVTSHKCCRGGSSDSQETSGPRCGQC